MHRYLELGVENDSFDSAMHHNVLSSDSGSFHIQISGCEGKRQE